MSNNLDNDNIKFNQDMTKHSVDLTIFHENLTVDALKEILYKTPEIIHERDEKSGWTLLFNSVVNNEFEIAEYLLKSGADPNIPNMYGETPLYQAVDIGSHKLINLLLEQGANPNLQQQDGETPLHLAAIKGDFKVVKLLVLFKADPTISTFELGKTPYDFAKERGKTKVVEILGKEMESMGYYDHLSITDQVEQRDGAFQNNLMNNSHMSNMENSNRNFSSKNPYSGINNNVINVNNPSDNNWDFSLKAKNNFLNPNDPKNNSNYMNNNSSYNQNNINSNSSFNQNNNYKPNISNNINNNSNYNYSNQNLDNSVSYNAHMNLKTEVEENNINKTFLNNKLDMSCLDPIDSKNLNHSVIIDDNKKKDNNFLQQMSHFEEKLSKLKKEMEQHGSLTNKNSSSMKKTVSDLPLSSLYISGNNYSHIDSELPKRDLDSSNPNISQTNNSYIYKKYSDNTVSRYNQPSSTNINSRDATNVSSNDDYTGRTGRYNNVNNINSNNKSGLDNSRFDKNDNSNINNQMLGNINNMSQVEDNNLFSPIKKENVKDINSNINRNTYTNDSVNYNPNIDYNNNNNNPNMSNFDAPYNINNSFLGSNNYMNDFNNNDFNNNVNRNNHSFIDKNNIFNDRSFDYNNNNSNFNPYKNNNSNNNLFKSYNNYNNKNNYNYNNSNDNVNHSMQVNYNRNNFPQTPNANNNNNMNNSYFNNNSNNHKNMNMNNMSMNNDPYNNGNLTNNVNNYNNNNNVNYNQGGNNVNYSYNYNPVNQKNQNNTNINNFNNNLNNRSMNNMSINHNDSYIPNNENNYNNFNTINNNNSNTNTIQNTKASFHNHTHSRQNNNNNKYHYNNNSILSQQGNYSRLNREENTIGAEVSRITLKESNTLQDSTLDYNFPLQQTGPFNKINSMDNNMNNMSNYEDYNNTNTNNINNSFINYKDSKSIVLNMELCLIPHFYRNTSFTLKPKNKFSENFDDNCQDLARFCSELNDINLEKKQQQHKTTFSQSVVYNEEIEEEQGTYNNGFFSQTSKSIRDDLKRKDTEIQESVMSQFTYQAKYSEPEEQVDNEDIDLTNSNNKEINEFLSNIALARYTKNFINNGFDDLSCMIEQMSKNSKDPITDENLLDIGILLPGHRARILIKLEELAKNFEIDLPVGLYYNITPEFAETSEALYDSHVKYIENWLSQLKMNNYISKFLKGGYYCLELMLIQMLSKNPINDRILDKELGIEKIGYRVRLLNKLKQGKNYIIII